jgi:RNA recognition motif-containing protein
MQSVRIQIDNLAADVSETTLRHLFLAYGYVESSERPLDRATGKPGTVGYVEMPTSQAEVAIKALNGVPVQGKPMQLKTAGAEEPTRPLTRRTVT